MFMRSDDSMTEALQISILLINKSDCWLEWEIDIAPTMQSTVTTHQEKSIHWSMTTKSLPMVERTCLQ